MGEEKEKKERAEGNNSRQGVERKSLFIGRYFVERYYNGAVWTKYA